MGPAMDETTLFNLAQRYVGRAYVPGRFDCADLACMVQRELFGRDVAMPSHAQRPASVARAGGSAIARLRDQLAEPLAQPATGCAVMFWEPAGDTAHDVRRWHVGTVFMRGAEAWVLHNSRATTGAALQRLADLQRLGLRLDGFYTWKDAA